MDPYNELLKSISAEQIEQAVADKIDSFHGFLTREVALKVIAKEKGLFKDEEKVCKIKDIQKDAKKVSFIARVEKIFPQVVYPSGKRSRSMLLKDETGETKLKLWEEGISLFSKIRTGSEVSVRNVYEKYGELNLGYKGTIEAVSGNEFTTLDSLPVAGAVHIFATVSRIEGAVNNAANGMVNGWFSFYVSDSKTEARAIITDGIDRGKKIHVGDLVIIDNARVGGGTEDSVGGGTVIIGPDSRLLVKRQEGRISGKIEKLEEENGRLLVDIGGKPLHFDRENAMKFFKVSVRDDISIGTVSSLKAPMMLNTEKSMRVRQENGTFIILE